MAVVNIKNAKKRKHKTTLETMEVDPTDDGYPCLIFWIRGEIGYFVQSQPIEGNNHCLMESLASDYIGPSGLALPIGKVAFPFERVMQKKLSNLPKGLDKILAYSRWFWIDADGYIQIVEHFLNNGEELIDLIAPTFSVNNIVLLYDQNNIDTKDYLEVIQNNLDDPKTAIIEFANQFEQSIIWFTYDWALSKLKDKE